MSWTLCTSGAAIYKAGKDASSVVTTSGGMLSKFSDETEGFICTLCHTDFVANYSSLNAEIKNALSDISSSIIANQIIGYDMSEFPSQRAAETLLDINDDKMNKALTILKDKTKQSLT